jgi:hypothetical protein
VDQTGSNKLLARVTGWVLRWPQSEVRDIYKFLYQAFHGPGHIVRDADEAVRMLISEWSEIEAPTGSREPVSEPVHIDGVTPPLFMIHLVRAKAANIEPDRIASLLLRTAEEFPGSWTMDRNELHEDFKGAWREVGEAIERKTLHLDLNAYDVFTGMVEGSNWPAVHHSDAFRSAYDPHYRLSMWQV